jgi:hypothetical protein
MATAIIPFRPISRPISKRRKTPQSCIESFNGEVRRGDHIVVRRNMAPWWNSPELGDAEELTIESIRDCMATPLTFDELVANISTNIGQYLVTCYSPNTGSTRQIWLNDCRIEEMIFGAHQVDVPEELSPIVAFGLSHVYANNGGGWATMREQSGPCIADRLRFVENVNRARGLVRPEQRDQLLIRPNLELAKVSQ